MLKMKKITTAQELELLKQDPAGSFALAADMNMAGQSWTPVDFAGVLEGNGHTIYNLNVEKCEDRECAGFFGVLSGAVYDLHFRRADIYANGTGYAGILAGVIEGCAEGCTVAGQICDRAGAVAGAMAGKVTGRCIGGTTLTVETGPHTQTGLCAEVDMMGKAALVGEIAPGAAVAGLWRDRTHMLSRCSRILRQRRQKAVDYMRAMATVKWQIDQDRLEYIKNRKRCVHYQDYVRGKVYMGIPYAHSAGGMARFLSVMASEKDGVYTARKDLPNGEYYVGEVAEALADAGISPKDNYGFTQYMGTDCSSAVSWAWRQVSSVDTAEGGCYGRYSGNMIPTEENKKEHGILPVGDFYACSQDTRLVLEQMGENALCESYAGALPGDGLCGYDTSGHVLMLSLDSVVVRNAEGVIDPYKSFVVTIEQGPGLYDSKGEDNRFLPDLPEPIQACWRVDYRYTFRNLARMGNYADVEEKRKYCGCDHVYLPITMQALQVKDTPAVTPRVWMEGSTVCSNFYITATQTEGAPIHTQISHDWHIYREFPVTSVDLAVTHGLRPGTHIARIHLSNEQVETVTFTVK